MSKVTADPRLPQVSFSEPYLRQLNARLYEIFREFANSINSSSDGFLFEISTATGNYTATTADQLILFNGTANGTVTLPDPAEAEGKRFVVKNISAYVCTVATPSGEIDGETDADIADQYTSLDFVSDGTNYWIV